MAIAFETSSSASSSAYSSSLTINKPSGVAEGDLMIFQAGSSKQYNCYPNAISGWTTIYDSASLYLAYKIAGSSEPSSYTITFTISGTQKKYAYIGRYSGVASYGGKATLSSTATSVSAPSVTTDVADCLLVFGRQGYTSISTMTCDATGTGVTRRWRNNGGGSGYGAGATGDKWQASAGASSGITLAFTVQPNYHGKAATAWFRPEAAAAIAKPAIWFGANC